MAYLKMPEVNHVLIAGNLTKDPVVRRTSNGAPVINFCLASNHRYRDGNNQWAEDVCYVGIVAWNKLADSCMAKLRKGSAVLVDGELQSRTWREDSGPRTVVEVKAHRIQFLNKQEYSEYGVAPAEEMDHAGVAASAECDDCAEAPYPEEFEYTHERETVYAAGFDEVHAREIFSEDAAREPMELKLRNG